MKKYLLLIYIFIPLWAFSQINGNITIERKSFSFAKQNGYDKIIYGHNYLAQIGNPEVPIIYRTYVIPTGAINLTLQTQIEKREKIEGSYYLFPIQPPQKDGEEEPEEPFIEPNLLVYNSSSSFPPVQAEIISDELILGYRVIKVGIYPFEYIPKERSLYLRDLSFTLNYNSGGLDMVQPAISEQRVKTAQSFISMLVDNSSEVEECTNYANIISETSNLNRVMESPLTKVGNIMQEIVPDYVIITNNNLKSAFKNLADWKTKKGVPTVIKTVEEIERDYLGTDMIEKIKNYLSDVKKRWNTNSLYILLGGDINIIPTRTVKSASSGEKGLFATDACYVDPSFTWIIETNGSTSSGNRAAFLGRIPVKNLHEANAFIDKILAYEKSLNSVMDYSYYNNFLFTSAYMNSDITSLIGNGYMHFFDGLRNNYIHSPTNYWYLFDHFNCNKNDHFPQEFDRSQGEELNKENFIAALKNGRSIGYFHFIFHKDHSVVTSLGISTKDKGEAVGNSEIDNLALGSYYNIMQSGSCHPANFLQDCVAEHFLLKGNTVAFLGNTDVGWREEIEQFTQTLKILFDNFNPVEKSIFRYSLGYIHLQALQTMSGSKHRFHLLGDPEMPVWTARPKNFHVNVSPDTIVNGENQITVNISNLPDSQLVRICLMKGEEGYAVKTVYATKNQISQKFTFTPRTSGVVDVTVTSHNFRPYETTVPVKVNENPAIYISDVTFDDDKEGGSNGNGDGQLDAGETVELTLTLKNSGSIPFNWVVGGLRCNSKYITILNRQAGFGSVPANGTARSQTKFCFKIDKDAPDIRKDDFNSIQFLLDINGASPVFFTDAFKIDVFAPEITIGEQDYTLGTYQSEQAANIWISLTNTGKAQATGLTADISYNNFPLITSCPVSQVSYPAINVYETAKNLQPFIVTASALPTQPVNVDLVVRNEYGKEWRAIFDLFNTCNRINSSDFRFRPYEGAVMLYWQKINRAAGYNIYRSEKIDGPYVKQNVLPVNTPSYRDEEVLPFHLYYYKVTAVPAMGNESERSAALKAWTMCPMMPNFPRFTSVSKKIGSAILAGDVDNDGKKELFFSQRHWDACGSGYLMGVKANGEELFDIDNNPYSFSGFAQLSTTAVATPAIGDLQGKGEQNILAVTWKDSSCEGANTLTCFTAKDENDDGKPDIFWQVNLSDYQSNRSVVLSNMDNSPDGTLEVIYKGITGTPMFMLDCKGNILYELGTSSDYTMVAVADLDGDGDKEIIQTKNKEIHIHHHNGKSYGTNPFFTAPDYLSSPVVCDLNNDGKKEILVAGQKTLNSKIYAITLDRQCLPGWDGKDGSAHIPYTINSLDKTLSVGDINNDGKLEVVALGHEVVKAWRNNGTEIFSKTVSGLFPDVQHAGNWNAPILADVDGSLDGFKPDIVFGWDTYIYALHADGSDVAGFPILTELPVKNSVCVADIDRDWKNELIAVDEGNVYAWKTQGVPGVVEWGSERHDNWNTGEYALICNPVLITSNTTWSGSAPCGNIIVQSGTLTIPSGESVTLNADSKIIVRPGATLVIDGGSISNGYIRGLNGSRIILKNNATIHLRSGGNFIIDRGAIFENQYGTITQ